MKLTSVIILIGVSLSNDTIITIDNNQNAFSVNDFIFIDTTIFNDQISETGEIIQLSDYDYGEINQSFYISHLSLYKLTDFGTVVKIPLLEEHINVIDGEVTLGAHTDGTTITVKSFFDGSQYRSKIGIQLLEAGNYYITDAFNNSGNVIITGGDYNLSYIRINSKIVNANNEGEYEFTVTE